jgi:hypothetical protein
MRRLKNVLALHDQAEAARRLTMDDWAWDAETQTWVAELSPGRWLVCFEPDDSPAPGQSAA